MTWQCCHKLRQVESDFFSSHLCSKMGCVLNSYQRREDYICILQRLLVSNGKLGRGIEIKVEKDPSVVQLFFLQVCFERKPKRFIHILRTKPSFSSINFPHHPMNKAYVIYFGQKCSSSFVSALTRSYYNSSGWHTKDSVMFLKRERIFKRL